MEKSLVPDFYEEPVPTPLTAGIGTVISHSNNQLERAQVDKPTTDACSVNGRSLKCLPESLEITAIHHCLPHRSKWLPGIPLLPPHLET